MDLWIAPHSSSRSPDADRHFGNMLFALQDDRAVRLRPGSGRLLVRTKPLPLIDYNLQVTDLQSWNISAGTSE